MFAYYLDLALRSLKRNKGLTALMVLAIALGIGASMTTLTVLHVLSGDPLPGRSATLYYPQLDPRSLEDMRPGEAPPKQVSWMDGMNLLKAGRADRQALMTGGAVAVSPPDAAIDPFFERARYTTRDFFPMFDVPFLYGHAWSRADDNNDARLVVLSYRINERLFGGADSTGKVLRMGGKDFRIVGVLKPWRPAPHFYDLMTGDYSNSEGVYLPLLTATDLKFPFNGSRDCWGNSANVDQKTAQCTWLQFWVQLDTPAKAAAYKQFLDNYSRQQKSQGVYQRDPNVRLPDLMQWLDYNQVVPSDVQMQFWLALGFLVVCLVNTIGLMLAKFLRRAGELGVRRALGASRRSIFAQLLVEAGAVGLVGGIGGLLLALAGLGLVRMQATDYAPLAHLDMSMLGATMLLAVVATLFAGLLPAWRACLIPPALQLKSN